MEVRTLLRRSPVTISRNRTLAEAAALMERHSVGMLVVLQGERVVGVVTDRDLVVRSLARGRALEDRVLDVMTGDVATVDASSDLVRAIAIMRERGVRRLPVLDNGRLVGVVTVDDLLVRLVTMLGALTSPVLGELLEDLEWVGAE
jgi:CBS domain-containing protein